MKPRPKSPVATRRPRDGRSFPIVGVGASAGGLEAFTQLLKQLPVDTGLGFVLVQHLDPQHPSVLTQLLARSTEIPVREVTDNLRVKPNHIYVIPPNTRLNIVHGVLKLQPRMQSRLALRSIDFFFEALAKDQRERAIGVILSGTATDGTLGLEAIKAEGGLTFAQDDSARYNSMPRSAVAAGCVDFVLPPETIASELARIARHPFVLGGDGSHPGRRTGMARTIRASGPEAAAPANLPEAGGYEQVIQLLRAHSGVDFSLYKSSTIQRRITRRVVLNRQDSLAHYADFLHGNSKELDALYADALISVTSFFRNGEAFDVLQHRIFTTLLQARDDEPLRVWVLGCSTGQEAYSIAMAYAEAAEKFPRARKLQIFATDLNEANLEKARRGLYPKNLVQDVSAARLRRFFVEEDGGYRINKPLREQVVFARHNLISDPPFSRIDLISCRNLMIYLEPSVQSRTMPAFHYALKSEGYLFLGASESVGSFTSLFEPVDKKHKIFAKRSNSAHPFQLPLKKDWDDRPAQGQVPRPAPPDGRSGAPDPYRAELSAEREADRLTINQFAPPAVLIDADLQILQFRGSTGAFLEPPTGKARFDLLKMARAGLMLPLRATVNRAKRENRTARKENVPVEQEGKTRCVNIEVVPLKNLKERRFLVLFEDAGKFRTVPPPEPAAELIPAVPPPDAKGEASRIDALERELAETRDYLQSVQENQEAANEELQAANEEGQSANEELQSLNEELETSKEELESTNEELTTVNEEMANRNIELSRLNSDLTNFQTSTKLVVLLLGRDLGIHRFSAQAEKQFNLVAGDLGRSIETVRHNLQMPDLAVFITDVITSVRESVREVQDKAGRWYSLRVRPYVTLDNKVDGAVLVLVDIDDMKRAEQLIVEAHDHAKAIIRTVPDPLVILSGALRVLKANDAFYRDFKLTPKEAKGHLIYELSRGSWDIPALRRLLEKIVPLNRFFSDFEVTHTFKGIGRRSLLLNARVLREADGQSKEILLGIHDITQRKVAEEALNRARVLLARHAGKLESQVARRTFELTAANQRLRAAVESNRRAKEEYRKLFVESQVMQAKLRQLTHQMLTVQEEERKKISRELHDEVVQILVGINVALTALGKGHTFGAHHLKEKIARTQRLVEKSVDAVHQFARELRPAVLDDLGLIPALHTYCNNLTARRKLKIHLTAFAGVEGLPAAGRTVLFRVAQEALTNVVRHAHADQVRLGISRLPDAVRMEISDNGTSFSVKKTLLARNCKRLGLVGMKERIEMIGGTLTIESMPGRGTTVRAEIPFKPKAIKK